MLGVGTQYVVQSEARLVRAQRNQTVLNALADGVVYAVILELLRPVVEVPLDGRAFTLPVDNVTARIRVEQELGKVDLNMAPVGVLSRLFVASGLDGQSSDALASRVAEWRQPSNTGQADGGSEDYRAAGMAYGPRKAYFESVAELGLVLGASDVLFATVQPSLTVHSQSAHTIAARASPMARRALLSGEEAFNASQPETETRITGDGPSPGVRSSELVGQALSITVEVGGPPSAIVRRRVIARLTGRPDAPVGIALWD